MDNRGSELLAVVILFLILSWLSVLARCWVRIKMIKAFALDDWLLLGSLLLFNIYSVLVFVGVYWGCGKHMSDLSVESRVNAMHAWYFGEIAYILTTAILRLAVGAFLLRIAVRKRHRYIVHGCNAINVLFNFYFLIFTIVQCSPINGFWLRFQGRQDVTCHADIAVDSTFAASAISAFIDWTFGLLPVFVLWELKMNQKKKVALWMIMGVGAIASTAPLVRVPYTASLASSHDFLWATTDVAIWSLVEPGLGITAIALAALRPLFVSLLKGSTMSSSSHVRQTGLSKKSFTPPRPPTPAHQYTSSSQLTTIKHAMVNEREEYWDDNFDLPLQHLAPMGHSVKVECGSPPDRRPSKLQKSNQNSLSQGRTSGDDEGSPRIGLGITKTNDFRSYSFTDESIPPRALLPFGPLEKSGAHGTRV